MLMLSAQLVVFVHQPSDRVINITEFSGLVSERASTCDSGGYKKVMLFQPSVR